MPFSLLVPLGILQALWDPPEAPFTTTQDATAHPHDFHSTNVTREGPKSSFASSGADPLAVRENDVSPLEAVLPCGFQCTFR